jgi:hypothetical protein
MRTKISMPFKDKIEGNESDRTPSSIRVICSDESIHSVNSHDSDVMEEFGQTEPLIRMTNTNKNL